MAETTTQDQLTKSQADRRRRVVTAALELASEGGYDAVQMRDVAARAQVALGTIYRYFASKDHLLAAALVEWTIDLERRVTHRPPLGDTTAARVAEILQRATRAMEKEPALSAAVVTALTSNDPQIVPCQREVTEVMDRIQAAAFPADFDHEIQSRIIRTLGHVWFSCLVAWVNGWYGFREARAEIDSAAHLLLDQFG